jgi:hypothetical protein
MAVNAIDRKTIKSLDSLLSGFLVAILALSFLMFTFVFIINWEDWFFGTRLAGPLAGEYLFAKAAVAFVLTFLLVQYPRYRIGGTGAAIAFFGFLFLDSSVTIWQNTAGQQPFSALFAVFLAIPVILFILIIFSENSIAGDSTRERDNEILSMSGPAGVGRCSKVHPLLLLLGAMVLLLICYILVIPLGIAMVITHIPFLHQMVLPPAHDTILVKVDNAWNREWTTIIPGYSLDFVQLVDGNNESCILFGTYWMPQQDEAQIRVLRIGGDGNRIWDMTRSRQFGTGPEGTAQIAWVEPRGAGAVVWLTNGGSLQLNENGAVIGETPEADTLPQRTTEFPMPPRYTVTELPGPAATLRIFPDSGQAIMLIFEDTISHEEIQSIYAVNPTADGGYLISASVKP